MESNGDSRQFNVTFIVHYKSNLLEYRTKMIIRKISPNTYGLHCLLYTISVYYTCYFYCTGITLPLHHRDPVRVLLDT